MSMQFDVAVFDRVGLGCLDPADKIALAEEMEDILASRFLQRIDRGLPGSERRSFLRAASGTNQAFLEWLGANRPRYREMVADEYRRIVVEVERAAPTIIEQLCLTATAGGTSVVSAARTSATVQPFVAETT